MQCLHVIVVIRTSPIIRVVSSGCSACVIFIMFCITVDIQCGSEPCNFPNDLRISSSRNYHLRCKIHEEEIIEKKLSNFTFEPN